jgi:hypothetical protein
MILNCRAIFSIRFKGVKTRSGPNRGHFLTRCLGPRMNEGGTRHSGKRRSASWLQLTDALMPVIVPQGIHAKLCKRGQRSYFLRTPVSVLLRLFAALVAAGVLTAADEDALVLGLD